MPKNTRTYAATLTVALAAALSPSAVWGQAVCPGLPNATACTIDNFTSGYGLVKAITTGFEEVSQPTPPATGSLAELALSFSPAEAARPIRLGSRPRPKPCPKAARTQRGPWHGRTVSETTLFSRCITEPHVGGEPR